MFLKDSPSKGPFLPPKMGHFSEKGGFLALFLLGNFESLRAKCGHEKKSRFSNFLEDFPPIKIFTTFSPFFLGKFLTFSARKFPHPRPKILLGKFLTLSNFWLKLFFFLGGFPIFFCPQLLGLFSPTFVLTLF